MIVFLILGTFAIFDPLRRQEKAEQKKERESHVLWLKDKKLASITVAAKGSEVKLECAKKDVGCPFDGSGDWILTAPTQDNADSSAVGSLASTLLNLTHSEVVDFSGSTPDPKEFGLDQQIGRAHV